MDFSYSKSGNVIAKSAKIGGAQFVINKGLSYIGRETEIHGERNNDKPVISWGRYTVLDDGCIVWPAQRGDRFYPMIIGESVYFGRKSRIEAASVGSYVVVGDNAVIGAFAVLKDGVVIPPNSEVPPYTVVGPLACYPNTDLPESTEEVISEFCRLKLAGVNAPLPFVQ